MKLMRLALIVLAFAALATACGSDDDESSRVLVGSDDLEFTTTINIDLPLTQEDSISLYESVSLQHDDQYIVENSDDLSAINDTLTDSEKLSFTDLDVSSYFLIKDFNCPDYYEFSKAVYDDDLLTITLDHYRITDAVCAAVVNETYLVFKATKNPL